MKSNARVSLCKIFSVFSNFVNTIYEIEAK